MKKSRTRVEQESTSKATQTERSKIKPSDQVLGGIVSVSLQCHQKEKLLFLRKMYRRRKQPSGKSILNLTSTLLDKLSAKIWMMSPPCQPFTRNNTTDSRDVNDNRSEPFLHLVDIFSQMQNPPVYLALENVIGFESSDCCQRFLDVLDQRDYTYQQYHLDPLKLGIPNSRPRYYCIAKLRNQRLNEGKEDLIIPPNVREIRNEEGITSQEPLITQRNLKYYLDNTTSTTEMVS